MGWILISKRKQNLRCKENTYLLYCLIVKLFQKWWFTWCKFPLKIFKQPYTVLQQTCNGTNETPETRHINPCIFCQYISIHVKYIRGKQVNVVITRLKPLPLDPHPDYLQWYWWYSGDTWLGCPCAGVEWLGKRCKRDWDKKVHLSDTQVPDMTTAEWPWMVNGVKKGVNW